MLDNRHNLHDGETFNGIRFADWRDDDHGIFEYRTKDGDHDFTFDLQPVPGSDEIRIYIVDQPGYDGRDNDGESTHRLMQHGGEHHGRPYVCVATGEEPTNVPDALSWLVYWAEKTGEYIGTGRKWS